MNTMTHPGIPAQLETSLNGKVRDALDGYCYSVGKGMWYYDVFSQPGSGPTVYRSLLGSAKNRIDIWDPFLHPSDAELFSDVPSQIDVRILTCFGATSGELENFTYNQEYKGFVERLKDLQSQKRFGLKIAFINSIKCYEFGKGKLPHDRFLFIDREAYVVGSSLQYHSEEGHGDWKTKVKNTVIYKVSDIENQGILYQAFSNFWNEKHEYYNRYVDVLLDKIGEDSK